MAADEKQECDRYDALLSTFPRDIQILGLGSNGHIAFNEPGTPFDSTTHVVELAYSTVKDNARQFRSIEEVPRKAFTMGLRSIMQAKKILLLANGSNKADAVARLLRDGESEDLPASILYLHSDCTVILDNFFQYPYINQIDLHRKVTWCDKSVFYQIFVDRFHIGETKKIRII